MTELEPRAGTTERTIYLTPHRVIDAPVEAVYAAWTEPELLRRWLAPGNATVVRAVAEVAVGGTFLVEMRGVDRRKWLIIMCPCGCGAMTRIGASVPYTADKYREAPLVEQRERYLAHLKATGARRSTLRKCANDQLSLVRLLNLEDGERVSRSRIEAAATIWARPGGRRCDRAAVPKTRDRFVSFGVRWLAFLGWLDEVDDDRHPHHTEVQAFARWSREEHGFSDATVRSYCQAADHFFRHLAAKGVQLSALGMTDIDDAMAAEHERGA